MISSLGLCTAPKTDIYVLYDHMSNTESILKTKRKSCYLLGDFNLNLLNTDTHNDTQGFIDLMNSVSLFPNITKPTRVTGSTATLNDSLFCNSIMNEEAMSGIIYADISDHYPAFYIDHSKKKKKKKKKKSIQRCMYISLRGHTHRIISLDI